MNDQALLVKAISFAAQKHQGNFRKGTDNIPYIVHPMEAAAIAATMTNDTNVISAAVLHDVVEDAEVSIEEIAGEFNESVRDLVAYESEHKREGLSKEETWFVRKKEAIEKLKSAPIEAKIVALSDKLSNIRAIKRDYAKKGITMWTSYSQKDHNLQGVYYKSLIHALIELKDYAAWQEYRQLVGDAFGKYPMPDRSNYILNLDKVKNGDVDLFRNVRMTSDWRPYIIEMWYSDFINYVTIFMSDQGIEDYTEEKLIDMLEREGILRFFTNEKSLGATKLTDPSGNHLWSITIRTKDEDARYATIEDQSY